MKCVVCLAIRIKCDHEGGGTQTNGDDSGSDEEDRVVVESTPLTAGTVFTNDEQTIWLGRRRSRLL